MNFGKNAKEKFCTDEENIRLYMNSGIRKREELIKVIEKNLETINIH